MACETSQRPKAWKCPREHRAPTEMDKRASRTSCQCFRSHQGSGVNIFAKSQNTKFYLQVTMCDKNAEY